MSKTVFVVFAKYPDETGFSNFLCVRRTFEKAAKVAKSSKPALILEVSTMEGETEIVNRCELS
ncbi:hypothetical protein LCGC14_2368210 [marine sediment metagenome]|uniref:Uncharacterized protein n=1 Tax=marine sediment metagenome TaxID=412755 RepID=A0A0F9EZ97_9ZZZZ